MKKIVKRGMALASAAVMIAGSVPMTSVNVLAAEDNENQTVIQTQSNVTVQADSQVTSGKWGTCDWSIENGVLTIGGGEAGRTSTSSLPWMSYKTNIKEVDIIGNVILGESSIGLFEGDSNLETINGLDKLITDNVTNMSTMFKDCKKLKTIDGIGKWNTSSVNSMMFMFSGCESLETIDGIEQWDTSYVKNMETMFGSCKSLSPDKILGKLDMSGAESISGIFTRCYKFENIDCKDIIIPNVTSLSEMFSECCNLKTVKNIDKIITSNITTVSGMFSECNNLTEIPELKNADISNVKYFNVMFKNCVKLSDVEMNEINEFAVNSIRKMFEGCSSLETIDLQKFHITTETDCTDAFKFCDLKKVVMPSQMEENESFNQAIASALKQGEWKDITIGKIYSFEPDELEAIHTNIRRQMEACMLQNN